MRDTDIYQTLEDRQNYGEVEEHGPYFCYARYDNGIPKRGYIICHTTYDKHSPLLYDLVGGMKHFDEFVECAELIKEKFDTKRVSFSTVLTYMKKLPEFDYKAKGFGHIHTP